MDLGLTLTAETFGGVAIEIVDCIRILDKGRDHDLMGMPVLPGSDERPDDTTSWGVIKGLYR